MPLYLIERNFAEELNLSSEDVRQTVQVNEQIGVEWLFSFLSADRKKTYCLYEAKDPELLLEHARVVGIPADVIVEVSKISPQAMMG
jgi:hypothetical protein